MAEKRRKSPRLSARFGARGPWTLGLLGLAAGLASLAQLGTNSSYLAVAAGLVPLGAGLGLAMPPATTAITDALPPQLQNVGSAVNDLARELGGALGIAVLSSLLTGVYRDHLHPAGVPAHVVEAARSSIAAATAIGGPVLDPARTAFADGLHVALLAASGVALAAALVVAALLGRRRRHEAAAADAD